MTDNATWTSSHAGSAACAFDWATRWMPLWGLLYYLAASLELALRGADANVGALSPQHGLLVALLLTCRSERWWVIALAIIPAHLAAYWGTDLPWWQLTWQAAHVLVLSGAISATLRLWLLQRNPFEGLADFARYLLVAIVVGPALLMTSAPEVVLAWSNGDPRLAARHWQAETVASALGLLTWGSWAYLALLPGPSWLQRRTALQYLEALLLAAALLACFYLTFVSRAERHMALYLFFIPLLWQSVRFGVSAVVTAVTLIVTLAAFEPVPHSIRLSEAPQAAMLDLQLFLFVLTLTSMLIAIVVEERWRIARAASASDARYRAIVESQTEFVCRSLPDTTLTFANAALCRYLNLPREKVLGMRWLDFVPVETRDELRASLARVTPEQPTFILKHSVTLPDGRTCWHEWANTAIFDAQRRLIEFQGTGRDVTALEHAESALRKHDERFSLILRAADDLIYDWDILRGEVWTSAGRECGEPGPSIRSCSVESWGSCIHVCDRERVVRDCREALRGKVSMWEAEYLHSGLCAGAPRWVRHRAYIVRDTHGTAVRMIGAITDLSDRKNLEEANRALERFARLAMVGQITASIAHEMNQPLGAIRYNAEAGLMFLSRERYDKDEFREILDDICRDNRRASDLIRRLRELLQDHELRLDRLNLNDVIDDVVKLMRVESRQRHVRLETRYVELPNVLGDYTRLQQVLLNLILNAMDAVTTFPEARRRISIKTARIDATRIQVSVTDHGCGIEPDNLPKIFDSFFTNKQHGMGLGLAIARSIVEAHGGRIWAENNADGIGATLAFEIDSLGSKVMMAAPTGTERYGARLN